MTSGAGVMNYKRLALVVGILVWLPLSAFLAHLLPDTDWPTAIISGPLLFGLVPGLLLGIVGEMFSLLWWWLREKPVNVIDHRPAQKTVALERWHRLWEKGIDPDTHKCENTWVKEGETQSRWGCRPCMEVEKELAE